MNPYLAILVILALFALRFGVPALLTFGVIRLSDWWLAYATQG